MMAEHDIWLTWQLADSAFPAGAFAHSSGLEAAWQQGEVDAASLTAFASEVVRQTGHASLPFALAAYDVPADLARLDARFDAFVRAPVANRASRVQGRAWLSTIERAFPRPAIRELADAARTLPARHYAPLVGATLRALDIPRDTAARLLLYSAYRGVFSAAVRLGIVGTVDAQRALAGGAVDLDRTLARCSRLTVEDAAQTAPIVELWQAGHDRLYSRLFQS